jgi:predicted CoA-binding protein
MTSRKMIEEFVSQPALALMGISRKKGKFGNLAYHSLVSRGYRVYPIHPQAKTIDGVRCYSSFDELPESVDSVLIVLPPASALEAVRKAAAAGVQRVWLQQGSEAPYLLRACEELGIDAISGECILMFARPASYHKVHRWLWGVLGKLPRDNELDRSADLTKAVQHDR